jgi:hypothetical protein
MLLVISPAKTLDFDSATATSKASKPAMLKEAAQLVDTLRDYGPDDLVALMGISHKLGVLNNQRYLNWHLPFDKKNAKQALLAFRGDVYTGLDADSFSEQDFAYAQQHLRILSGLYGVLRPLDFMQPYRLEMGTRLKSEAGETLYEFWADKPAKAINKQLRSVNSEVLINLASNEYFKAIDTNVLKARVVTPVFKDFKNGKYKIVSFYAKKARGLMASYIIKNRIEHPDAIKKFNLAGYKFDKETSTESTLVFLRKEPVG